MRKYDKNLTRRLLKIILIPICSLVVFVGLFVVISFALTVHESYKMKPVYYQEQLERLDTLAKIYSDKNYKSIDENLFTDFNTNDINLMTTTSLHSFRALATHNSYKQGLNPFSSFFFNYCIPFMGNYNYSFEDLTTQLNNGIRSFELDITVLEVDGKRKYEVIHHPLLDNKTSIIDFQLGLREIALWSKNNPQHMPITVLLEIKPKDSIAGTEDATINDIEIWSTMMHEEFGETYYTSQDMLGAYADYSEFTKNDAYPNLESMKGKIIFLLHDGELAQKYVQDVELKNMEIFPMITGSLMDKSVELRKITPFSISNYPTETQLLTRLTETHNLIVRTRLDDYPTVKTADFEAALSGNAQILTTDWPPTTQRGFYIAYLKGDKTMILGK